MGGLGFADRFAEARSKFGPLVLGLDPSAGLLAAWGQADDALGLERFVDVALEAAAGTVGVVKPQSAFYERHGSGGIRALERLISSARAEGILVLLDAKRGDVGSTNEAYAAAYLAEGAPLRADALTVTAYLGLDALEDFFGHAVRSDGAVFVVARSSNPEGRPLQRAEQEPGVAVERALVEALAIRNRAVTSGVGPFGAVFAPNHGRPADIDLAAMGGLFLAPGLGAQGATPGDMAECFAACPERVLPAASRALLSAGPDVSELRDAVSALGAAVGEALAT